MFKHYLKNGNIPFIRQDEGDVFREDVESYSMARYTIDVVARDKRGISPIGCLVPLTEGRQNGDYNEQSFHQTSSADSGINP